MLDLEILPDGHHIIFFKGSPKVLIKVKIIILKLIVLNIFPIKFH